MAQFDGHLWHFRLYSAFLGVGLFDSKMTNFLVSRKELVELVLNGFSLLRYEETTSTTIS